MYMYLLFCLWQAWNIVRTSLAGLETLAAVGASLTTALSFSSAVVGRPTTYNTLIGWVLEVSTRLSNSRGWELLLFGFRSIEVRTALHIDSLTALELTNEKLDEKRKSELARASNVVYKQQSKAPSVIHFGSLEWVNHILRFPENSYCPNLGRIISPYIEDRSIGNVREGFLVNTRVTELVLGVYKAAFEMKLKIDKDYTIVEERT